MPHSKSSSPGNDGPVFSGFGRRLFSFFDALAKNQNKEWFHAHQDEYETQASNPMQRLVKALSARFATQRIALSGSAKTSLFRVKGFESHAGTPVAETLKLKSFVVKATFTKKSIHEAALVDRIAAFAGDGWPLTHFFRDGL